MMFNEMRPAQKGGKEEEGGEEGGGEKLHNEGKHTEATQLTNYAKTM